MYHARAPLIGARDQANGMDIFFTYVNGSTVEVSGACCFNYCTGMGRKSHIVNLSE